jgi:hypothetical protein
MGENGKVLSLRKRWSYLALSLIVALNVITWADPHIAQASDGTPFSTINVPGTFEAEDFNSWAIKDVYYAHPSSQVTRDTTYRDVTNVSSNDQAVGSSTAGYVSEYFKIYS